LAHKCLYSHTKNLARSYLNFGDIELNSDRLNLTKWVKINILKIFGLAARNKLKNRVSGFNAKSPLSECRLDLDKSDRLGEETARLLVMVRDRSKIHGNQKSRAKRLAMHQSFSLAAHPAPETASSN